MAKLSMKQHRILELLADGPRSSDELAVELGVSRVAARELAGLMSRFDTRSQRPALVVSEVVDGVEVWGLRSESSRPAGG